MVVGGGLSPPDAALRSPRRTPPTSGIAAGGATLAEAFENAAFGMFDLMFDLSAVEAAEECRVEASAETDGELLVAWLSALLAEAEIRGLAFGRFRVEMLAGGSLSGYALGSAPPPGWNSAAHRSRPSPTTTWQSRRCPKAGRCG